MHRFIRVLPLLILLLVGGCQADEADPGVVAEAAGQQWRVEDAAALLAADSGLPATREVVRAVADLWVDYTLLATAAAEDTSLSHIDVTPLVRELVEERLLLSLRDSVIEVDTLTAGELQERYAEDAPGSFARARHILIRLPQGATPAQRDSAQRVITTLRRRIVEEGEDFAALASSYSQDPASASQGGAMGVVGRGQLVGPLQATLDALEAGQVSQPVESPYGIHLIKVEERLTPSLEQFRAGLRNRFAVRAESAFIAGLEATASPETEEGALSAVKALARRPRAALAQREEVRPLIRYRGGEVTQGEVQRYMQNQSPHVRNQIAEAEGELVPAQVLRLLLHRELLLAETERRGWSVRPEVQTALVDAARKNLAQAARQMGLSPIHATAQQDRQIAVKEAVDRLLSGILSGRQRQVTPLGAMSHVLRSQYPSRIADEAIDRVVARLEESRPDPGIATDSLPSE